MIEINNTLSRFANSFDLKDWKTLKSVLAENVNVDYADLRGKMETLSRDQYVAQREAALQELNTHHILSNIDIEMKNGGAIVAASAMIYRSLGEEYFDSHVIYGFKLEMINSSWRITSIKQTVLWNEGNSKIHTGARTYAK